MSGPPSGWIETTLGDACSILAGYGFPERLQGRSQGDLAFFKVGDISENWKRGESVLANANHYISFADAEELRAAPLPANTVVFAKIGAAIALNRRALLSVPSLVDNNVMGLHQQPELLHPKYLFHFACTLRLDDLSRATTVPSLRKGDVASIRFPLAPFAEQKRIVAEIEKQFTRLDAAVAALKRVQANLKRYRAAVLKAACEGRLVPTEAELARKEGRSYETGEQLLARILKERRTKWEADQLAKTNATDKSLANDDWRRKYKEPAPPETTELPDIPNGWQWASMDQLLHGITAGKSFRCEEREPARDEFGVVKVSSVTWGEFDEHESKTCLSDAAWVPGYRIEAGDFLFSRANTIELVGACIIVKRVTLRLMLSDKILRFVVSELVPKEWILFVLRSKWGRYEIERLATGNQESMRNIGQDRIRRIRIPIPPARECLNIINSVDASWTSASLVDGSLSAQLRRADRLRQSILKRAFDGELVPQDPNDEPASALLERMRADRATKSPLAKKVLRVKGAKVATVEVS